VTTDCKPVYSRMSFTQLSCSSIVGSLLGKRPLTILLHCAASDMDIVLIIITKVFDAVDQFSVTLCHPCLT